MGGLSIWHLLIVLAVVVLVFGGGGKLSKIMGDFGKGIKERKREEDEARGVIDQARPVGTQTVESGVRHDDVLRR
jgi:sec-independent protein translocase protein TatA